MQDKSQAQPAIDLPFFLKVYEKRQFEGGAEIATLEEGGVSSWPEAVQYLMRNYVLS